MAGDLLSIGKSGLYAAQAGLSTTGHNITNANVAGYSRQTVVQATNIGMETAEGFYGTGSKIAEIRRHADSFLNTQVRTAQASYSALDTYNAQISQIDDLLADTSAGLSPALQDFFKGVQDVARSRASVPSRQSLMSAADTLASRFQQMNSRLQQVRDGVNNQIGASVTMINTLASQIADLNQQIGNFAPTETRAPNDLMDQREQLVLELNKYVKAEVSPGENHSLTVTIGSGMPLVVGSRPFTLVATTSPTDQSRVVVGYKTADRVTILAENALPGGELGALMDFRAQTLDRTQNAMGRIAIGLAQNFNAQHKLGLDANGVQGKDFFAVGKPFVGKDVNNNITSTTSVNVTISDPDKLTTSDYKLEYDGSDYFVTRLSDNTKTLITTNPQTIDGVDYAISGVSARGDNFVIRPTINGAAGFKVAISDGAQIAAAAPIGTSKPVSNKGTGAISPGTVDASFFTGGPPLPVNLQYNDTTKNLDGFPAALPVTVVTAGGATTTYAAGAPVPFTADATYTVGGVSFTMSGVPQDTDKFVIEKNVGTGDVRNVNLLGALQTKNILNGGSATLQSSYAEMVNFVGNKAREVQVNASAGEALLNQARSSAQDVSGVNLDEEATNLLRYQQAYQAAGKIMQAASTVFETLLSIGR